MTIETIFEEYADMLNYVETHTGVNERERFRASLQTMREKTVEEIERWIYENMAKWEEPMTPQYAIDLIKNLLQYLKSPSPKP